MDLRRARARPGARRSGTARSRPRRARRRAGAVVAQQDELERIERDLHDGAQARLVALSIDLGVAREKLESEPEAAAELIDAAHAEAKSALAELRELG